MKEIHNILIKYFSGSINDEEKSIIQDYKKNNPLEYESIKMLWKSKGKIDVVDFNTQKAWGKTERAIEKSGKQVFINKNRLSRVTVIAAVFVMFLISTWFVTKIVLLNENTLYINDTDVNKIVLSDGSSVWLNSDAELSYPNKFKKKNRSISLTGEVYFEVVGNQAWPFHINTPTSEITVLGTSFDVKANEIKTEVIVNSGEVYVESGDGKHNGIVEINESAVIENSSLIINLNTNLNYKSWQSGIFQFDSTAIQEVVRDLNAYYKNQITIDSSSIFDCAFTGYFSQANLSEILETLVLTCGVNVVMDKDHYKINNP